MLFVERLRMRQRECIYRYSSNLYVYDMCEGHGDDTVLFLPTSLPCFLRIDGIYYYYNTVQ